MIFNELRDKLETRRAAAGVAGLGYVGLPLAMAYADAGFRVVGYDIDEAKVKRLTTGEPYVGDVSIEELRRALDEGKFEATTDPGRLSAADVLAICVPTPLTAGKEPDLSYLNATAETVARHLRPGQLVIVESTVYPGATREEVLPRLETSGLKCGHDFWVAFSPERVDPGNKDFPLRAIPTVVGGLDPAATELAATFYRQVVNYVVVASSAEAAEMSKLLENIYRAVNIALVNELKLICNRMGLDVFEVIGAAATKPYGFQKFLPGPGVGGHCIPLDPYYLSWRARRFGVESHFVELAGAVNDAMPAYVVSRLETALRERGKQIRRSKILVLGVTYKPGVEDLRESPAFEVMERLLERGAALAYHDPYVPALPRVRKHDFGLFSVPLTPETVAAHDATVILTDHAAVDYGLVLSAAPLVVDTRGVARRLGVAGDNVVTA